MQERLRFVLDGCDISFAAEAPSDITLKQLLEQCDRIKPDWCRCGIRSYGPGDMCKNYTRPIEIHFDYDDVRKADDTVPCTIEKFKKVKVKNHANVKR